MSDIFKKDRTPRGTPRKAGHVHMNTRDWWQLPKYGKKLGMNSFSELPAGAKPDNNLILEFLPLEP